MDNKITKDRIKRHLSYSYLTYIVVFLLLIMLWWLLYAMIGNVKDNEKISIFVGAYDVNSMEAVNGIREKVNYLDIKQIRFNVFPPNEDNYSLYYGTGGVFASDIFIISDSKLKEKSVDSFLPLTYNVLDEIMPSNISYTPIFYSYDGINYGIKIYDATDNEYNEHFSFSEFILFRENENSEAEDYYLLININSPNIGSYSVNKKARDNQIAALIAVHYLLDTYSE